MKHSPAPWRWKTVEGYGSSWLYDADGNQIWHSITTPSQPDSALIAAAPNLLFRLKKVSDFLDLHKADLMGEDWRTMMVGIKDEISDL